MTKIDYISVILLSNIKMVSDDYQAINQVLTLGGLVISRQGLEAMANLLRGRAEENVYIDNEDEAEDDEINDEEDERM